VWEPFFADDAPIFRHGVTYSGHATACAVAHANLDVLESEQLADRVKTLAPVLTQAVEPLAKHPLVTEVRSGIGLLAGVQLAPDVDSAAIARACLDEQVVIRIITNNTIQISPPFVIEEGELWRISGAIATALDRAAELLPAR
jgi:adenosylmethionine-8-amino-7-oxononanoate aminotransferase